MHCAVPPGKPTEEPARRGVGIAFRTCDENEKPILFEPFYTGHGTSQSFKIYSMEGVH